MIEFRNGRTDVKMTPVVHERAGVVLRRNASSNEWIPRVLHTTCGATAHAPPEGMEDVTDNLLKNALKNTHDDNSIKATAKKYSIPKLTTHSKYTRNAPEECTKGPETNLIAEEPYKNFKTAMSRVAPIHVTGSDLLIKSCERYLLLLYLGQHNNKERQPGRCATLPCRTLGDSSRDVTSQDGRQPVGGGGRPLPRPAPALPLAYRSAGRAPRRQPTQLVDIASNGLNAPRRRAAGGGRPRPQTRRANGSVGRPRAPAPPADATPRRGAARADVTAR
ncbi:hypothetical protein EVAR_44914_1 [Eumeta japonica]|uniref:Uncharacterized protein n=1 Tax=Eumeta variegata TaxID=151549 RepID=A0A4C1XLD2_EUMVA|nr:hypothetical protein EVAR_44914_1 [Eumeta japonica]